MSEHWVEYIQLPDREARSAKAQVELRRQAKVRGQAELLRSIVAHSCRVQTWHLNANCKGNGDLFFPQSEADIVGPSVVTEVDAQGRERQRQPHKSEKGRPERLAAARALCAGDETSGQRPCAVWGECLGWTMGVGRADKWSFSAGMSSRARRDVLADARRRALTPLPLPRTLAAA